MDNRSTDNSVVARILGFIEQKLLENVLKNISLAMDLIVTSVSKLREGIQSLTKNDLKKALADCEAVDHIEHDADDQKRFLSNPSSMRDQSR